MELAHRAVGVAPCRTTPLDPADDVLTWRLARRVMVDHEVDVASASGGCRCCGQHWPCDAWRRAEDIAAHYQPPRLVSRVTAPAS